MVVMATEQISPRHPRARRAGLSGPHPLPQQAAVARLDTAIELRQQHRWEGKEKVEKELKIKTENRSAGLQNENAV